MESSAHNLPEEREAENPQNVAQIDEVNTAVVSETSSSATKVMSILQSAPIAAEVVGAREVNDVRLLTIAEKGCVLPSSGEYLEDLIAFVTEGLQCLTERGLTQFVGDKNMNVMELLCRSLTAVKDVDVDAVGNVGTEDIN